MSEPGLKDLRPSRAEVFADVRAGLHEAQKYLSPIYFYDERGSQLFDEICRLPEYYPTRTEMAILNEHGAAIAEALGPHIMLVEPGSGTGAKARQLLSALEDPVAFVPVEISLDHLVAAATALNDEFPSLEVLPVCADFSREFALPETRRTPRRRVVFFPGSTIGNFSPGKAARLLANFAAIAGPDGRLLVGVDLRKDRATLERAYNDAAGVTARFNLNVLERLNRELGADFAPDGFDHRAVWNPVASRIEMHLVSARNQVVHLGDETIRFTRGETIHTESSYKYSLASFATLARSANLRVSKVWTDPERLFSLQLLQRSAAAA